MTALTPLKSIAATAPLFAWLAYLEQSAGNAAAVVNLNGADIAGLQLNGTVEKRLQLPQRSLNMHSPNTSPWRISARWRSMHADCADSADERRFPSL